MLHTATTRCAAAFSWEKPRVSTAKYGMCARSTAHARTHRDSASKNTLPLPPSTALTLRPLGGGHVNVIETSANSWRSIDDTPNQPAPCLGGAGKPLFARQPPLKVLLLILSFPSISSIVALFKALQLRLAAPHAAFFSLKSFAYPSPLMACAREAPHARVRARTHEIVHCSLFPPKKTSLVPHTLGGRHVSVIKTTHTLGAVSTTLQTSDFRVWWARGC